MSFLVLKSMKVKLEYLKVLSTQSDPIKQSYEHKSPKCSSFIAWRPWYPSVLDAKVHNLIVDIMPSKFALSNPIICLTE